MGDVFLDAFLDSLKVLAVLIACGMLIAFIEPKISKNVKLKGKFAPFIGVSVGLLPQCGFSVVATDLYQKRHITVGTLLAVYLATSDEALPIFLSRPDMAMHILPIIALKFVLGLVVGYTVDLIYTKGKKRVEKHLAECKGEYTIRLSDDSLAPRELTQQVQEQTTKDSKYDAVCECGSCARDADCECGSCARDADCECGSCVGDNIKSCKLEKNGENGRNGGNDQNVQLTEIEKEAKKNKIKTEIERILWEPITHSLKIFVYIFAVNIVFGVIIFYVGEERLIGFLVQNKYLAPLFAVFVGAVPNCVASVVISNLYLMGGLGFGATLGGLCMNAGLAFVFLFKNTKAWKENLAILMLMLVLSVAIGYIFSGIFNFEVLHF